MASIGMLKNLPCPAGKSCTAFKCFFKHPSDEPAVPAKDAGKPAAPASSPETPRKRVKLSSDSSVQRDIPSQSNLSVTKEDRSARDNIRDSATSSTKPISPPPIQRNTTMPTGSMQNTQYGSSTQKISNASIPSKPPTTPSTQHSAKSAPSKPETLNPRHLKKAPAKHDVRWKLVKLLHAEYERLNSEVKKAARGDETSLIVSQQQLITMALDTEEDIATKRPAVYSSVMKNKVMSYKKMTVDVWKAERADAIKKAAGNLSPSKDAHKPIETGLTPAQEVVMLTHLASPLLGLEQFGYVSAMPKDEDVEKAKQAVAATGNVEICDRCTSRFTVFPGRREEDGALASGGPCIHHPGKPYFIDGPPGKLSSSTKKWRCCDQTVGDTNGCVTGKHHVFKTTDPNRLGSVLQFAETPPNPDAPTDRAVCFDCEMGYTVYGMELIRLTAVSWPSGDELLDVLVYPVGEYIDLNTRYSGVRPEDMANAERWKPGNDPAPVIIPSTDPSQPPQRKLKIVPSPKDARDLFFSLISPDIPLVGHGLENDLNALRVIHPTIVDSILLYPHKRGLPIRNGLKWLTETILGRKIQVESNNDDEPMGHDSAEDARAAGELVKLKVKNEWKNLQMKGWTLTENGQLKAPEDGWTVVGGKKRSG